MSNQYDMMLDLKSALESDLDLNAWAHDNFSQGITVILTNTPITNIQPEQYPCCNVVYVPGSGAIEEQTSNSLFYLDEHYGVGAGIYHTDPATATRLISEMEILIVKAVHADRSRNGMADNTTVVSGQPDGDLFHPRHHRDNIFQIIRSAEY